MAGSCRSRRSAGAERFRLISATHQDLRQRVAEERFRHDLYFRLITFEIEIPPLRQRSEDIAEPGRPFLRRIGGQWATAAGDFRRGPGGGRAPQLVGECPRIAQRRRHAMILARGGSIAPEHLPPPLGEMAENGGRGPFPRRRPCEAWCVNGPSGSFATRPAARTFTIGSCNAWSGRCCWPSWSIAGAMPGRRPPPRLAPHDPPQETRRAGNRRCLDQGGAAIRLGRQCNCHPNIEYSQSARRASTLAKPHNCRVSTA